MLLRYILSRLHRVSRPTTYKSRVKAKASITTLIVALLITVISLVLAIRLTSASLSLFYSIKELNGNIEQQNLMTDNSITEVTQILSSIDQIGAATGRDSEAARNLVDASHIGQKSFAETLKHIEKAS